MTRVLYVSSEAHPLMKTGGLADVSASLPRALLKLGCDLRLLLPAYPAALEAARSNGLKKIAQLTVAEQPINLWQTRLPGTRVSVWLLDHPLFSARPGNPYVDEHNQDWPDNHRRFLLLAQVAQTLAMDRAGLDWRAQIVHCSDWQTGLIPVLLSSEAQAPKTLFTIHNLAYRGLFSWQQFAELQLPHELWHYQKLEFYQQFSFIKGGLVYADWLTTVSPSYAEEIQQPENGFGLDGLLRSRHAQLTGILNGVNYDEWNPGRDQYLEQPYTRQTLARKSASKAQVQAQLGLATNSEKPLLGFIGRLVEQKGIDLMLAVLPRLLQEDRCQIALLGSGQPHYEAALQQLVQQFPERAALRLGYSEALAHQIEAGADVFLMPSLFEPCGLNQLYSLRYGTPPVAHAVGGLRDTITDNPDAPEQRTGFLFNEATPEAFAQAIERALALYHQPDAWKALQRRGMSQDFSWQRSAESYVEIYQQLLEEPA